MKKLILCTGLAFMALAVVAQQRDPKAKALLDAVSSKFKSYSNVMANFSYVIQNNAGKVLSTKKGTVQMKGSMFNINFGGNKIISDGKTVWNYDPVNKEVTVNNVNNSEKTITPQKLFTSFYEKDFTYSLGGVKKMGKKSVQEVLLQPTDRSKSFSRVYLWIDKAANAIVSANIVEKSGNRFVYTISNMKTNTPMQESLFVFNKASYPGVEVVDLR
jgi:chaperone LolA